MFFSWFRVCFKLMWLAFYRRHNHQSDSLLRRPGWEQSVGSQRINNYDDNPLFVPSSLSSRRNGQICPRLSNLTYRYFVRSGYHHNSPLYSRPIGVRFLLIILNYGLCYIETKLCWEIFLLKFWFNGKQASFRRCVDLGETWDYSSRTIHLHTLVELCNLQFLFLNYPNEFLLGFRILKNIGRGYCIVRIHVSSFNVSSLWIYETTKWRALDSTYSRIGYTFFTDIVRK